MTIWEARVQRDIGPHGADRAAVWPAIAGTSRTTGMLKQCGPAYNDRVTYIGTFATREDAVAAVRRSFPNLRIWVDEQ